MSRADAIRFGPAGNSTSFYEQGYTATLQAFEWVSAMGLNAFEYSFGRGVTLGEATAEAIGAEAARWGVAVSAHAPYYINLANPDPDKRENSFRYMVNSARVLRLMGGSRVVVHVGSAAGMDRAEAIGRCNDGLLEALTRLDDAGLAGITLCVETMGKHSQIGNLEETLAFCSLDCRLTPCIDFAHLHALGAGSLAGAEAFAAVLDRVEEALGPERARRMHIHFSTIEFTKAGERRHRTFAEEGYGPRFEHLAPLLVERDYRPVVICESKGTMAEDAAAMRAMYNQALAAQHETLPAQ